MYSLYLYFLGLSLRNTSRALQPLSNRSYTYLYGNGFKNLVHFQFIEGDEFLLL